MKQGKYCYQCGLDYQCGLEEDQHPVNDHVFVPCVSLKDAQDEIEYKELKIKFLDEELTLRKLRDARLAETLEKHSRQLICSTLGGGCSNDFCSEDEEGNETWCDNCRAFTAFQEVVKELRGLWQ